jgi:hypothetical protein
MAMAIEARRDHALLYRNRKKRMLWQADFVGVTTLENGDKYWIFAYEKKTDSGDDCLGIKLVTYAGEDRR